MITCILGSFLLWLGLTQLPIETCCIIGSYLIYRYFKYLIYWRFIRNDEDKQRDEVQQVSFSNPYNNRDDQKFKHLTRSIVQRKKFVGWNEGDIQVVNVYRCITIENLKDGMSAEVNTGTNTRYSRKIVLYQSMMDNRCDEQWMIYNGLWLLFLEPNFFIYPFKFLLLLIKKRLLTSTPSFPFFQK